MSCPVNYVKDCDDANANITACPTCTDEIQNQGETGVDCGGPCQPCPPPPPPPPCTDNDGDGFAQEGGPCGPRDICDTCPLIGATLPPAAPYEFNPGDGDSTEYSDGTSEDGKDDNDKVEEPGTFEEPTKGTGIITPSPESCNTSRGIASSVKLTSGALRDDLSLFANAGSGLSTSLTFYYDSLSPYNGPLGIGWSHSYDLVVKENAFHEVILKDGRGRYRLYELSGSGYASRPGDTSTLEKTSDGRFVLTHKDGTRFEFGANQRLARIGDRNGNAMTFNYSGNNLIEIIDGNQRVTRLDYDGSGKLTGITDPAGNAYGIIISNDMLAEVLFPDGGGWRYSYIDYGFLSAKTDPAGHLITYAYDETHRLIKNVDAEGGVREIVYPTGNEPVRTTAFTDKDGSSWLYTYNVRTGDLSAKTDPLGNVTSYTYDANHNQLTKTDASGTVTSTYDAVGNLTTSTDVAGQTTSYTYNAFGQVTSITAPDDGVTRYDYDEHGNLTSTTDASGATTGYSYDSAGRTTSVTTPEGGITRMGYDAQGNLVSITDPSGATQRLEYDASGRMIKQLDPQGGVSTFEYDARGNLIKSVDPLGNVSTFTYDANGRKTSATDANGNTTRFETNAQGQVLKSIDALDNVTSYAYGGSGCPSCGGGVDKLTSLTDANGNTTRFEYDVLGRKVKEIDPFGNASAFTYDAKGNVLTRTDAAGRATTFAYDPLGRIKEQIDPLGGKVQLTYDTGGRLTKVVDPVGVATGYEYDTAGRMVRTDSPDAGTTTYAYNTDGSLKTKTDANGTTTTYSYDAAGRLAEIRFPDARENVAYTFDTCANGKGRVCSMTDASGTTTYSYDALGRIVTEQKLILGITYTTSYEYDKTGQLKAVTYPSGRRVEYTYDKLKRPMNVAAKLSKPMILAQNLVYDGVGNLLSSTFGNGLTQSWTYDPANRTKSIDVPGALGYRYTYDLAGNITAIANAVNPTTSKTYAYDALDRLSSAQGPWGSLGWSYDANSNRLTQQNGVKYTYSYDGNRLESVANGHIDYYRYDAIGNTISDGKRDYVYNHNSRLSEALENGRTLGEYTYNSKGQRVVKKTGPAATSSASGQTTVYHYDLAGRLIEETAGNGKLLVDYVCLGSQPLAMLRKQGNGEETLYYHNDHLGTSKVLTDKLGKVVWNVEFDPFGNEIQTKGRQSYIRNVENNLRFPGQYFDTETGLHQNGFRDYHPNGRYIESDPIGLSGGLNRFVYVQNAPIRYSDTSGLAYFAYRPLRGPASILGVNNDPMLDYFNLSIGHEQLFFEDGNYPFNLGFFDDGLVRTEMLSERLLSYEPSHSSGWNDCVMRKAVENVKTKTYCFAGRLGPADKYNCQDWVGQVRNEYRRLVKDEKIVTECCVNNEEKVKQ